LNPYQKAVEQNLQKEYAKELVHPEHENYGGIGKTAPKYNRKMTTFGAAMAVLMGDFRKNDALLRNFIADENAQQYPTGKKPETEIGVIPLLAALGLVAAVGVGTTVYSDDIQNAIDYLKLQAFGPPIVKVTGDSRALGLAAVNITPAPVQEDVIIDMGNGSEINYTDRYNTIDDPKWRAIGRSYVVHDGIYIISDKSDKQYLNYVIATLDFFCICPDFLFCICSGCKCVLHPAVRH